MGFYPLYIGFKLLGGQGNLVTRFRTHTARLGEARGDMEKLGDELASLWRRHQFFLLAGFKFGSISFHKYMNGDIPFRNRLFPEKIGSDVKIIDLFALFYDEEKFSKLMVDDVYLRMVNNIDAWNLFPWESSCVSDRWWTKVPEIIPRALSWRRKAEFKQYEYFTKLFRKQETLKKVVPQSEDYLQSTSEDELDIKDHTSPKENGLCALDDNRKGLLLDEHYKYTYISKQEDQIIRLVDQRQQDHIINMVEVVEQKIQSEIQRLYNHKEARLNKIAEENKQKKCLGHMNSSAHMKLAIKCCVPKKEEDLSRPFKRIDKIFLSHELQVFLSRAVVGRCKFPWYNDITVDRSFWNGLSALDDNRKVWMLDETNMDWAMVISYFLPLLLQGSMPLFYANNNTYPVPWSNIERVFIPINEPLRHLSLAMFHMCSGVVTFYDSERTEGGEYGKWYLQMRDCLEEKIHVVLKEMGVFKKNDIDPRKYKIYFK
nr:phospholipase-like protein [Tanacetum cinerariifolium]